MLSHMGEFEGCWTVWQLLCTTQPCFFLSHVQRSSGKRRKCRSKQYCSSLPRAHQKISVRCAFTCMHMCTLLASCSTIGACVFVCVPAAELTQKDSTNIHCIAFSYTVKVSNHTKPKHIASLASYLKEQQSFLCIPLSSIQSYISSVSVAFISPSAPETVTATLSVSAHQCKQHRD